jgi:hypothetical protein
MSSFRDAVADRAVWALAIVALVGAIVAAWCVFYQAGPGWEGVPYVEEPTYDELWPMRLQAIASFLAGPATIAAVGACIGLLIVIAARVRRG